MIYQGPRLSPHVSAGWWKAVAYHEAGHAAMAAYLGWWVGCVRITAKGPTPPDLVESARGFARMIGLFPQGPNGALVTRPITDAERPALEKMMLIEAAGPVAERWGGEWSDSVEAEKHFRRTCQMALRHEAGCSPLRADQIARYTFAHAEFTLARRAWPGVRAIANALLRYRHVEASKVLVLYQQATGMRSASKFVPCEGTDGQPCDRPKYIAPDGQPPDRAEYLARVPVRAKSA